MYIVGVDTTLLADALNKPIHCGDLVLDDAGRVYFVDDTENSFLRQGFLRVHEARMRRKQLVSSDAHTYVMAAATVVVPRGSFPGEIPERRRHYFHLIEPTMAPKVDELRRRRELRRL